MSVGLLLITHHELGKALLNTAVGTLGHNPFCSATLSVARELEPEVFNARATRLVNEIDSGDGVLVLTDMYGSTPGNIACCLRNDHRIAVVAGVNLPMLLRIFNYAQLDLDELTEKALSGGRDGVIHCPNRCPSES